MKKLLTLFLFYILSLSLHAQWSNTTNVFTDSLHMSACTATGDQGNTIIIKSYPDGGYFLIWEDKRAGFYNPSQIFAQKYDANGNRLWSENGVLMGISPYEQRFSVTTTSSDYRNYSYGASDGAGGLYFTYTDDSVATYGWYRIMVQHIRNDGSLVFPGPGFIVASTPPGNSFNFSSPQLISDDAQGFYISYSENDNDNNIYVYDYKEVGGQIVRKGGGQVNENIQQVKMPICTSYDKYYFVHPTTTVSSYHIWPDLQGNCNIVMSMSGNIGGQGNMLCINKVWKAKKKSTVTVSSLSADGNPLQLVYNYEAGDIDILYKVRTSIINRTISINCIWVDYTVLSNGYLPIDGSVSGHDYDFSFPKGATLTTSGNINVDIITYNKRGVNGNITQAIGFAAEKYDSVPYERASFDNVAVGFNINQPTGMNTLQDFRDTILAQGTKAYDFSLTGGGTQFYAAALVNEPGQDFRERNVRLQHLAIEKISPTQFSLQSKTNKKKGELIGKEVYTGFSNNSIFYEFPLVTINPAGHALFYINETGRSPRISPIKNGAELAWGAMGKPIGSGIFNGNYYYPASPFVALDPLDGTGVIGWQDSKNIPPNSRLNISFRHLDNLNTPDYLPPVHAIKPLPNPPGGTFTFPVVLTGTSKSYTMIEAFSNNLINPEPTPVIEILDNYNLGNVSVNVYQNSGTLRSFNGKPYLDRNYNIQPENNPNGLATIDVRLYLTLNEFNALKSADASITNPGSLVVVKQPTSSSEAPAAYTPVPSETIIVPSSWQAVDGGYYLQISVNRFSNFFIEGSKGALPVTWLGIQAQRINENEARVSWQIAQQINVKDYTVQFSNDGSNFKNVCSVLASSANSYNCIVETGMNAKSYYRVLQQDIDGKYSYSNVVLLNNSSESSISVYPNPAKNKLFLQGVNNFSQATISDVRGKILSHFAVNTFNLFVDISRLSKGIYFIKLTSANNIKIIKFIKE